MNPQTRSVIKAALIGLAVSIAVVALNAFNEGRLAPIDTYQIFNPEVIARWIGRLCVIPLIFVIVAIVRNFRGVALWISALNFLGAIVGISLAISIGVVIVSSVYPVEQFPLADAGPDRNDWIKTTIASCITGQRRRPENAAASDELISTYCRCYANILADSTTREDIQYMANYHTPSAHMREEIASSFNKCAPGNKANTH